MPETPYKRAHHFNVWFCEDPKCGPHTMSFDEYDNIICETVMSPKQALEFMKICQDELYAKAIRGDDDA